MLIQAIVWTLQHVALGMFWCLGHALLVDASMLVCGLAYAFGYGVYLLTR